MEISKSRSEELSGSLVGRTVIRTELSPDRMLLCFVCVGAVVGWYVDGDCCSESWIEDIDTPITGTVRKVTYLTDCAENESRPSQHRTDCCVVTYYGVRVETDQGVSVIDFRNDSNGYYGGWMSVDYVKSGESK